MERDYTVTIHWLNSVASTQSYLKEALKSKRFDTPVAVATLSQTAGIGSRGKSWIGVDGNLFFSFAISKKTLPDDLKLESASIYFMYLLKETFEREGSKLWLKWPNDLYVDVQKIGGCITTIQGENLICGIGINMKHAPENFGTIDIRFDEQVLLKSYLNLIEKNISWKQVFSNYKLEFENNRRKIPLTSDNDISLIDAQMMDDGSLMCDGTRIYSQR